MKNIITFCISFSLIMGLGFAQNIKLKCKWLRYDADGEITTVANYENGKKEGKWFVVLNETVKELNYKSNKLITVKNVKSIDLSFI